MVSLARIYFDGKQAGFSVSEIDYPMIDITDPVSTERCILGTNRIISSTVPHIPQSMIVKPSGKGIRQCRDRLLPFLPERQVQLWFI